ncbi:MAG: 23S rRNA (adenine(2030)-N(6))-methyltransferase RlmJ [Hyphomonas sp.]
MLSYQHGFHAGNRADVLKHAILHAVLTELGTTSRTCLYVETHSGRGRYDLTGAQAKKGGEAEDGVLALLKGKAPKPLLPWLDFVKASGVKNYPGSPAHAQALLTPQSRMILFEKHPAEYQELVRAMGDDPRLQVKHSDGYSGSLKLSPRGGETMVCFVDPSYETGRDIEALAGWTPRALKRWPKGLVILWLPLFRDGREEEAGEYLTTLEDCVVAGARWPMDPLHETALEGSAIVIYRPTKSMRDGALNIASALQSWWAN